MAMQINQEHVEAIRRSIQLVGHISTILVDQNGRELAGRHRSLADQAMPRQVCEVQDGFHRELIILLSNVQRQPGEDECRFRLNRVAMELWLKFKCSEEKVCATLCDILAPEEGPKVYSRSWIIRMLDARWKTKTGPKKIEATSISRLGDDIKKVTTALDLQNVNTEDPYPFQDCRCSGCPHTENCY